MGQGSAKNAAAVKHIQTWLARATNAANSREILIGLDMPANAMADSTN